MDTLLKRTLVILLALVLSFLPTTIKASVDDPPEGRPIDLDCLPPLHPRSIECEVAASIDDKVVTVSFSELTASQIVVTDSADLTVFNQTYTPAYSAQADLSLLPSGNYTLYIYVQGYGLYGSFLLQ